MVNERAKTLLAEDSKINFKRVNRKQKLIRKKRILAYADRTGTIQDFKVE